MKKEILALIPARSGSKGIPDKNLYHFHGKPLLLHSIEQALNCNKINRLIVSTDSEKYALVAKNNGAEVPFLRPSEIAQDSSTDFEVFEHALNWLEINESYFPDYIVHLRPTYPTRKLYDIEKAIDLILENDEWDSIRSICESKETPYKMWNMNNKILNPIIANISNAHSAPRQSLPKCYLQNACVDVIKYDTIKNLKSMAGNTIGGYLMDDDYDIDSIDDLCRASEDNINDIEFNGKTFCFDIDGVIASITPNNDYKLARPIINNINIINELYKKNNIILFTARGYVTGLDWEEVTKNQMEKWKVKYHELKFGKPAADFYVDDRILSLDSLQKIKS